jgi:hypothetical protein
MKARLERIKSAIGGSPNLTSVLPTRNRLRHAAATANTGFCYQLTGAPQDYGNIGDLAQTVTSDAATFECWVQIPSAAQSMPMTVLLCPAQGTAAPRFEYDGGDKLGVYWNIPAAYSSDATPISDGQWHHIAVVFDRGSVMFYKDGVPTAESFAMSNPQASGAGIQIGAAIGDTNAFNGLVYDVRVWNEARMPSEIQSFMYATLTGQESGLVALTNFSYCDANDPSTLIPINQVNGYRGFNVGNANVTQTALPQQPMPINVWTYPISGIAPLGPIITPQGLFYAENVAVNGNTPAGNYLRSLDVQTNGLNWTYSVHDNSAIPTPVIPASLGASNGVAYVGAQATNTSGSNFVELHAVDGITGQPIWSAPAKLAAQSIVTKPVAGGGIVVMGVITVNPYDGSPQAGLFWADLATGQTIKGISNLGGEASFMTDPIIQDGVATLATATRAQPETR